MVADFFAVILTWYRECVVLNAGPRMPLYSERTYRSRAKAHDMASFQVAVKETDLWVSAGKTLERETLDLVIDCRYQLETYIRSHPDFVTTLSPYQKDDYAPPLVKRMIQEAARVGVGPMSSVAGAIAQHVGEGLLEFTDNVIVENGGDVYIKADRAVTVSIFAGPSSLSERLGLLIPVRQMPVGVCSSSGSVGHSFSAGIADAVCLVSHSAVLADAAATALGNRIQKKTGLEKAAEWAGKTAGISGGVVIVADRMATWGDIELVEL